MEAAHPEAMLDALVELYIRTVRKGEESEDRQAVLKLYIRELSGYPGDLAMKAIKGWRGKFFPALTELTETITASREYRRRVQVRKALQAALTAEPKPERKPVTYDFVERLKAKFGEAVRMEEGR